MTGAVGVDVLDRVRDRVDHGDGFEYGMGAEIGNSTQKLHARGPIGMRELTTFKYVARGNGQVRE